MTKKKAAPEAAEEPAEPSATPQKKKTAKKAGKVAAEEQEEQTVEVEVPAPEEKGSGKKRKKKSTKEASEEDAAVNEDVGDEPPKKAKKAKKIVSEADQGKNEQEKVEEEEEEAPAKKKKKKKGDDEASKKDKEATEGEDDGNYTVFVGGIPWAVEEELLRKDFTECGEVAAVNLLRKENGLSRGIAFISFATKAGLDAALKYDGEDYGGRVLQVYKAEDRKGGKGSKGEGKGAGGGFEVFVRGIPCDADDAAVRKHFGTHIGSEEDILTLSLPTRATGKNKGFAWLTFSAKDAFKKALELNDKLMNRHKLLVEEAGKHKQAGDSSGKGAKGKGKGKGKGASDLEIFVNNLSYEATEKKLRAFLKDCGEISRIHMPNGGEGKCKGFAWVTFNSKVAMQKALDLEGEEFEGRRFKAEKSGQHLAK